MSYETFTFFRPRGGLVPASKSRQLRREFPRPGQTEHSLRRVDTPNYTSEHERTVTMHPNVGAFGPTSTGTTPAVSPAVNAVGGSTVFWRVKRLVDIVVSLLLLPMVALLALALLVLNRKFNRGPLLFLQRRMGQDMVPFTAIKFRTMQPDKTITRKHSDPVEQHRITTLGRVMRKTRIDELPQILNVLKGEMSLIGPRPDFLEHAREFVEMIPEYRHRHLVRPGISGFAQVTLGYAEGIDATRAKANADLAYIRNASFFLEARIFWLTLVTVFLRRGA